MFMIFTQRDEKTQAINPQRALSHMQSANQYDSKRILEVFKVNKVIIRSFYFTKILAIEIQFTGIKERSSPDF